MITTHSHRMSPPLRQPEQKPGEPAAKQQPLFSGYDVLQKNPSVDHNNIKHAAHTLEEPLLFSGLDIRLDNPSFNHDDISGVLNSVYGEEAPLQKLQDELDHTAPRGKSRVPAFLEVSGETAGGIAMDLSRLVTALPVVAYRVASAPVSMGYNRLARQFDHRTPEQRQSEERKTRDRRAISLTDALMQKVNLDEIQDEHGGVMPKTVVKARVLAALKQKPDFMSLATDALDHPILATMKWPLKAKPDPQDVVQILANADFSEVAQAEDESAHAPLLMQPLHREEPASSSRPPSFSLSGQDTQLEIEPLRTFTEGASTSAAGEGVSEGSPGSSPAHRRLRQMIHGHRASHKFKISENATPTQKLRIAAHVTRAVNKFKEVGKNRETQENVLKRWQETVQQRKDARDAVQGLHQSSSYGSFREAKGDQPFEQFRSTPGYETFERVAADGWLDRHVQSRAKALKLDIGQSEKDAMVRDMQISGSLWTRGARALANGLRKNPSFQPKEVIDREEFQSFLEKGKLPPTKNPYQLMVLNPPESGHEGEEMTIRKTGLADRLGRLIGKQANPAGISIKLPNMRVSSTDPNAKLLLAALLKGQEANLMEAGIRIAPGTQVAVKVRDTESFMENVLEPLVSTFRLTEQIRLKDGQQANLKESCLWPFLESVIMHGDKKLGPNCTIPGTDEKCFDRLAKADVYRFESNNKGLEQFLNDRMRAPDPKMKDLKARLAAIQAASLHYAEQVEIRETVESFLKGAIVGVTGEAAVENTLHPKPGKSLFTQPNYWANVALLGLVDAYDNWQGEQGALEADLKGMGLRNIPEHVFGEEAAHPDGHKPSMLDNVKRYGKLLLKGDADGPAAQSVGNAYRSALLGAAGGVGISMGAAQAFSHENSSIPALMGATSGATLGTGLSIPINFALTLPRVMATYNEHLQAGRLTLPDDVNPTDQKAVFNHVRETALQEMMARVGLQASAKAYTVVPSLGLSWLANIKNAVPRKVIQPLVFGTIPAAENLSRLGFTADRLYRTFPQTISQAERMVLASHLEEKEDATEYQKDFRKEFNDGWSSVTSKALDYLTYPILQVPLTFRRKIDYVKQPVGDDMV